jgi:hypothetical protein
MEIPNGARIEAGERSVIITHLGTTYPGTTTRQTIEWLITAGAVLAAAGLLRRFLVRRRASGRRDG